VPNNYPLTLSANTGTIYFTTDGVTDPRAIGGAVNTSPAVKQYTGSVPISGDTTVMARVRNTNGQWSGLIDVSFTTVVLPGDYNGSGTVTPDDYNVWRSNFGATVAAYSGADGNGDGVVDAADYSVWRDNLGASLPLGAAAVEALFVDETPALESSPVAATTELAPSFTFIPFGSGLVEPAAGGAAAFAPATISTMATFDSLLLATLECGILPSSTISRDDAFDQFDPAENDADWLDLLAGDSLAPLALAL
jgi:hypothetical protein